MTTVGPAIRVNAFGADPIAYGATGNPDILYVGSGDNVFVRTAGGLPLTPSTAFPGRGTGRLVADIAIHRSRAGMAFVVDELNVYQTPNSGGGWTNITGNLSTLSPGRFLSIAFSTSNPHGSVVVGTMRGVFVARGPSFNTWSVLGTGLPRAPAYDLGYDPTDHVLVAGLLGRGTWIANLEEPPPAAPQLQ